MSEVRVLLPGWLAGQGLRQGAWASLDRKTAAGMSWPTEQVARDARGRRSAA